MDNMNKNIDDFLGTNPAEGEQFCDPKTGVCYIKSADGLIERVLIDKKLVIEDGRELLKEETPISHTKRSFIN